jgi:hypothetical protein
VVLYLIELVVKLDEKLPAQVFGVVDAADLAVDRAEHDRVQVVVCFGEFPVLREHRHRAPCSIRVAS